MSVDPFRSARLVYRAIEEDDEKFFLSIELDSIAQQNSGATVRPGSKKDAKKFMKYMADETALAVVICLPVQEDEVPVSKDGEKETADVDVDVEKKKVEKLIPVGQIHLGKSKGPNGEFSRHGSIGVDIVPPYRDNGYGTEAIKWITDWGFNFAGLHRVEIGCFTFNEGARKLYSKLGFVYEGASRENIFMNGGWHGIHEFGLLDREWKGLKEQGLW